MLPVSNDGLRSPLASGAAADEADEASTRWRGLGRGERGEGVPALVDGVSGLASESGRGPAAMVGFVSERGCLPERRTGERASERVDWQPANAGLLGLRRQEASIRAGMTAFSHEYSGYNTWSATVVSP
jgi:hypothetical protein